MHTPAVILVSYENNNQLRINRGWFDWMSKVRVLPDNHLALLIPFLFITNIMFTGLKQLVMS